MGTVEGLPAERPFWEKPLETLDRGQWEALCDGCGKCCLHKVEDEDDGRIYPTNVACKLLDVKTAQCSDYRKRKLHVPDCMRLTLGKLDDIVWLPSSCTYILRSKNLPLPPWHYLISGDRETIHKTGNSVKGRIISEVDAGPLDQHIIPEPL